MASGFTLRDLGVRGRLTLLTGLMSFAVVCIGGAAALSMARLHSASQALANEWLPRIAASTDMTSALSTLRSLQYAHIMGFAPDRKKAYEVSMDGLIARIDSLREQNTKQASSENEREMLANFDNHWTAYKEKHVAIVAVSRTGDSDVAGEMMTADTKVKNDGLAGANKQVDASALFRFLSEEVQQLLELNRAGAEAARLQAQNTYDQIKWALLVAVVMVLAASTALAVWIVLGIVRPLSSVKRALGNIAEGNLTANHSVKASGEMREILDGLEDTRFSLLQVVEGVRDGTVAVTASSIELARSNLDLSDRTERQSSNLQRTASAIEELSASLDQNSDASHKARALATAARTAAESGGQAVGTLVATMADISSRSSEIVDIVTVIDGIAFQTNILALNAAVEAARAGESGRGFAVVASEVRALSVRSADAAKQVRRLVMGSVERIEMGTGLANGALDKVNDIVDRIREVTDNVQRISDAIDVGAKGIGQINESIAQMNSITQENAALVEEGAAASETLKFQAENLKQSIEVFRLN